ncbi:methyltransferase family protein [Tamilnaduibacter salinus]|uniref:2-polyprenyl-3-methyl-5-hydroxy-6-metoxy-1, 4-benzoquinol methylase n=1 Tax=Tamilnaduibacter salinus TaxID=1484056 RepID=A0A2A2I7V9_9GAMM|nr:class I SAM-dependent methyltransferase [Tamilnaduibacter salinus]PAV27133.1 2-polyprenyl-3-methyl-5-hydroxy-6-metoxy-1,4-benzoquinol methylase [Tamilnaduibacter salinus]PVY79038.1 methyltransferase family protein [Tamilnaduibacter salinus]
MSHRRLTRCTVCDGPVRPFQTVRGIDYWRCGHCEATIMDPAHWPTLSDEQAVYDLHENDVRDPGYRRFLSKLVDPLLEQIPPGSDVLDFGCGPGPALAAMLSEAGMRVAGYDPIYAPDPALLDRRWPVITATEVIEHLHDPGATFQQLDACLEPGGWLAVMTCFQTDDERFANWHYRRDPTHVVFYREHTLATVAARHGWSLTVPRKDVALFQKHA